MSTTPSPAVWLRAGRAVGRAVRAGWRWVRAVSGDDAHERHVAWCLATGTEPSTRAQLARARARDDPHRARGCC